jgi:hypothetical protein
MIDLYRSRFGLQPLCPSASGRGDGMDVRKPTGPDLAVHAGAAKILAAVHGTGVVWPLPGRLLGLVGEVVVWKLVLGGGLASSLEGDEATQPEEISADDAVERLQVKAMKVEEDDFSKLLFCNVGVHRRMVYLERAGMLVRAVKGKERVLGLGLV